MAEPGTVQPEAVCVSGGACWRHAVSFGVDFLRPNRILLQGKTFDLRLFFFSGIPRTRLVQRGEHLPALQRASGLHSQSRGERICDGYRTACFRCETTGRYFKFERDDVFERTADGSRCVKQSGDPLTGENCSGLAAAHVTLHSSQSTWMGTRSFSDGSQVKWTNWTDGSRMDFQAWGPDSPQLIEVREKRRGRILRVSDWHWLFFWKIAFNPVFFL